MLFGARLERIDDLYQCFLVSTPTKQKKIKNGTLICRNILRAILRNVARSLRLGWPPSRRFVPVNVMGEPTNLYGTCEERLAPSAGCRIKLTISGVRIEIQSTIIPECDSQSNYTSLKKMRKPHQSRPTQKPGARTNKLLGGFSSDAD